MENVLPKRVVASSIFFSSHFTQRVYLYFLRYRPPLARTLWIRGAMFWPTIGLFLQNFARFIDNS